MGELEQRALPHTMLLPLYARLSAAEQQRVFQRMPQRRVVLATNVAETSLTIPGIVYVVDPGLARVNRYDARTGVTQLLVEPISQASADQRKGRCGRTAERRVLPALRGAGLRVAARAHRSGDQARRPRGRDPAHEGAAARRHREFPFLDPPPKRAIDEGYRVLEELGAIDEDGELTPIGEQLGRLPLDPRLGRMILGGARRGRAARGRRSSPRRSACRIRASGRRRRSSRPTRRTASSATRAATSSRSSSSGRSGRTRAQQRRAASSSKLCRDNFLSYHRMREWDDIHEQIVRVLRELDFAPNDAAGLGRADPSRAAAGPAQQDRHVEPRGAHLRRRAPDPVRDPSVVGAREASRRRG